MAKRNFPAAMSTNKQKNENPFLQGWTFTKINYILFGLGLLFIIAGYFVMAAGEVDSFQSLTLAPIMLFIGYIVLIPLALIIQQKKT